MPFPSRNKPIMEGLCGMSSFYQQVCFIFEKENDEIVFLKIPIFQPFHHTGTAGIN